MSNHIEKMILSNKIDIIKGMPSDLYTLSYYVRKMDLKFPNISFIQSGGEVLDHSTRKYIEDTFCTKILETYSSVESGLIGYQIPSLENSFVSPKSIIIEANDKSELPKGDYDIYVTNLNNFTTPIIRYQCGDIIKINDQIINKPTIIKTFDGVYGKYLDFLVHPNGNLVSAHVVKQNLTHLEGIDRFQVNQPELKKLVINLEINDKFNENIKYEIMEMMKNDLGDEIDITFVFEKFNGKKTDYRKFKVISSVPAQEILSS